MALASGAAQVRQDNGTVSTHLRAAWRAVGAWDLPVVSIERVSISENIVFRVRVRDGGDHVLRLHRPGYHTLAALRSEQAWTAALLQAGVDVPVVVKTRRGRGYARVPLDGEARYAGMLEWVDGVPMGSFIDDALRAGQLSVACERFGALGAIMAAIHNHATAWPLPDGFVRHALDADGFVGEQPFWGRFWESPRLSAPERRRLAALRGRVSAILRGFEKAPETYSLLHADLHPGNVIVAANGEDLHMIDFDDAGFGWHAYEFAIALHGYQEHPAFADFLGALTRGYRNVRPLADEVAAQVPLFLLVRSLASIGWTAARPEHERGGRSAVLMARVERTADETLAAWPCVSRPRQT